MTMERAKREKRPPAPGGKHRHPERGFYHSAVSDIEQQMLAEAREINSLDEEIALLRVKIAALLAKDPDNYALLLKATDTLARLVRTKYGLTAKQGKGLREAITKVLTEVATSLGIQIVSKI